MGRASGPAAGARLSVVLVTGATGFVGSYLVRALQARGDEVHAIARKSSDRELVGGERVVWHSGELTDRDSLMACARSASARAAELGVDLLAVHGAAVISYKRGDRDLQERVNVGGTLNFLVACREAGVRRLVHVSSVVAVGVAATPDEVLDESASYNGSVLRNDYTDTKREAELAALSESSSMQVVVVNPGAIYGEARVLSNTSRFMETLRLHPAVGRVAPPGSLSCVGVLDVANGIVLALEQGEPGQRYLLTESNLRLSELYDRVACHHGRRARAMVVSPSLWNLVVLGSSALDRCRRAEFATPQALRLLGAHFRFSSARARTELGWKPMAFDGVLEQTLGWLSER